MALVNSLTRAIMKQAGDIGRFFDEKGVVFDELAGEAGGIRPDVRNESLECWTRVTYRKTAGEWHIGNPMPIC
ncbi:hypothetical protein [Emcibacter sp.]|uniref:hypothetical protein n=1 Tax=Emcibacter sp. TaxID=1979954 RepID=UPI003A8CD55A